MIKIKPNETPLPGMWAFLTKRDLYLFSIELIENKLYIDTPIKESLLMGMKFLRGSTNPNIVKKMIIDFKNNHNDQEKIKKELSISKNMLALIYLPNYHLMTPNDCLDFIKNKDDIEIEEAIFEVDSLFNDRLLTIVGQPFSE